MTLKYFLPFTTYQGLAQSGILLGEPEKAPTFENSLHHEYFTYSNDSISF